MPNYDRVYDLMALSLAAVQAQYVTAGFTPPERAYLTVGDITQDEEQLTVALIRQHGIGPAAGFPAEFMDAVRCTNWRGVQFACAVTRCSPTPRSVMDKVIPPAPSEYLSLTRQLGRDAEVIRLGLVTAWRAGDFGEGLTLAVESMEALPDQGGIVGVTVRYRLSLV